jgi:hypothetical protein
MSALSPRDPPVPYSYPESDAGPEIESEQGWRSWLGERLESRTTHRLVLTLVSVHLALQCAQIATNSEWIVEKEVLTCCTP